MATGACVLMSGALGQLRRGARAPASWGGGQAGRQQPLPTCTQGASASSSGRRTVQRGGRGPWPGGMLPGPPSDRPPRRSRRLPSGRWQSFVPHAPIPLLPVAGPRVAGAQAPRRLSFDPAPASSGSLAESSQRHGSVDPRMTPGRQAPKAHRRSMQGALRFCFPRCSPGMRQTPRLLENNFTREFCSRSPR